jgi:hypothetical protein
MKQYKTIAGPVTLKYKANGISGSELGGLRASDGEGYDSTVRQYAKTIDKEAVGGWELLLIQQVTVKKLAYNSVFIGAIIGAVLTLILVGYSGGRIWLDGLRIDYWGGFFLGAIFGALFGCLRIKYVSEVFNMLVFVKDE